MTSSNPHLPPEDPLLCTIPLRAGLSAQTLWGDTTIQSTPASSAHSVCFCNQLPKSGTCPRSVGRETEEAALIGSKLGDLCLSPRWGICPGQCCVVSGACGFLPFETLALCSQLPSQTPSAFAWTAADMGQRGVVSRVQ